MGSASILLALAGMLPASLHACSYGDQRFVSYWSVYTPSGSMPDDASNMLALPLSLRFLRPSVSQCNRTVPHLLFRCRIWIQREIAEALKLIAFFQTRIR
jgi:hypothetical protein